MIAHLARLAGAPGLPALGPLRQRLAQGYLDVDEGGGREPAAALESTCDALPETRRKGRIDENDVVGRHVRGTRSRQKGECVRTNHADLRRLQPFDMLFEGCNAARVGIEQRCRCGAARTGLETESPAAREQVEHMRAADVRCEPVEQRLADAIRRGSDGGDLREAQASTTPHTGDDANLVGGGAASRGHLRRRVA